MIRTQKFILFYFSILFFSSCSSEIDPEGIWYNSNNPKEQIVIQNKAVGSGIAIRNVNGDDWSIYSKLNPHTYLGKKNEDIKIQNGNTIQFVHKENNTIRTFFKSDKEHHGIETLNVIMPREKVLKFLGESDTIIHIKNNEKWFYGNDTVVIFDKIGVIYFSDNYKMNWNFDLVRNGMHQKKVLQLLGEPERTETDNGGVDGNITDIWMYGDNAYLVFSDSLIVHIVSNIERQSALGLKKTDSPFYEFEFQKIDTTVHHVHVFEREKIIDKLIPKFNKRSENFADIKLLGKKYWLVATMQKNNRYRAAYSRILPQEENGIKHKEGYFRSIKISIDPDLLKQGFLAGKISGKIKEKKGLEVDIQGTFVIRSN